MLLESLASHLIPASSFFHPTPALSAFAYSHRMTEVKRILWRSSSLNCFLQAGHLQQVAQDHAQMPFEYLKGQRLHIISGPPVQCSVTLTARQVFYVVLWFSLSWQHRTTQLLSHSPLPGGMGRRIRRKRQNSLVVTKSV